MTKKGVGKQAMAQKYLEQTPDDRFRQLMQEGASVEQAIVDSGIEPESAEKLICKMKQTYSPVLASQIYAGEYLRQALIRLDDWSRQAETSADAIRALTAMGQLAIQAMRLKTEEQSLDEAKAGVAPQSLWTFRQ